MDDRTLTSAASPVDQARIVSHLVGPLLPYLGMRIILNIDDPHPVPIADTRPARHLRDGATYLHQGAREMARRVRQMDRAWPEPQG